MKGRVEPALPAFARPRHTHAVQATSWCHPPPTPSPPHLWPLPPPPVQKRVQPALPAFVHDHDAILEDQPLSDYGLVATKEVMGAGLAPM